MAPAKAFGQFARGVRATRGLAQADTMVACCRCVGLPPTRHFSEGARAFGHHSCHSLRFRQPRSLPPSLCVGGREGSLASAYCRLSGSDRSASARCYAAKGFLKELQELKESGEREDRRLKKQKQKGKKAKAKAKAFGSRQKASTAIEYESPLEVLLYPHPKLRAANLTVTDFDENLASFATELFEVMYETDGIGLAAPQVGVNVRVMVYNPTGEASEKDQEVVLVNPRYVNKSKGQTLFEEGCLSFPEIMGDVKRPKSIVVEAQDLKGDTFRLELEGLEARIFQHEYDHLEGVLFHDRMHPNVLKEVTAKLQALEGKFESENPGVAYQGV